MISWTRYCVFCDVLGSLAARYCFDFKTERKPHMVSFICFVATSTYLYIELGLHQMYRHAIINPYLITRENKGRECEAMRTRLTSAALWSGSSLDQWMRTIARCTAESSSSSTIICIIWIFSSNECVWDGDNSFDWKRMRWRTPYVDGCAGKNC